MIYCMFSFSFYAVSLMRMGISPSKAAEEAIKPIIKYYPKFSGAVVAANVRGEHGKICFTTIQAPRL